MKKYVFLGAILCLAFQTQAQSVTNAYTISQNDLIGTARYVSMAGAFGALGGDLTAITQNPAGIGIYRSNEIGATVGVNFNSSKSLAGGMSSSDNMTRFSLNNVGAVFTLKLYNNKVENLNFGFSYNKTASFDRRFKGVIPNLPTSLSNYIAGLSNSMGLTEVDVSYTNNYDPYNPPYGSSYVPWLAILGYNSYLTTPEIHGNKTNWYGQFEDGSSGLRPTSGNGYFDVNEKGSVDNYNIVFGGNINNKFYIGVNFDVTSVDYKISSSWGEALDNAYVYNETSHMTERAQSDWILYDKYHLNGTGFKFNMGMIYKPIQELRIGFAFHTPTFYNLKETFYDTYVDYYYQFANNDQYGYSSTNDGYPVSNAIKFSTPWRLIASVAGVLANKFIVSADYEWATYKDMRYSDADIYYYNDPWYDWDNPWNDWWGWGSPWYEGKKTSNSVNGNRKSSYENPNDYANSKIKQIYKNTSTLRVGVEYRVLSNFSLRAGYSFTTSPIESKVKNYKTDVPGIGVMTNYTLDNMTNYITAGIGFKHGGFYADLAYSYKNMTSEYFPYSPDLNNLSSVVKSKITTNNSNVILSLGYKF